MNEKPKVYRSFQDLGSSGSSKNLEDINDYKGWLLKKDTDTKNNADKTMELIAESVLQKAITKKIKEKFPQYEEGTDDKTLIKEVWKLKKNIKKRL